MDMDKNLSRQTSNSGIEKKRLTTENQIRNLKSIPTPWINTQQQAGTSYRRTRRHGALPQKRDTRDGRHAKGYKLCDSISTKCPQRANLTAESG